METLQERVENLSKHAIERNSMAIEARKKERQWQWQGIQEKAPHLAVFLVEFNKAFGKPKTFDVKFHETNTF